MPSPSKIMRAVAIAQQHLAELGEQKDPRLRLDTIEGQSQALELVDALIEDAAKDRSLSQQAKDRAERLDKRYKKTTQTVLQMLQALGLATDSLERPMATIWVQYHTHVILTGQVDAKYMKTSEDMRLIHRDLVAGKRIDNATLSNPEPSLRFSTK